ncbi:MAG: MMPL family transporter [Thermoplasmata archaeon]|nr:MAG: MMPL family transporter [Thermoplasmata archaeon]
MTQKICPKCQKEFEEDWNLCDECGVGLVIPAEETAASTTPLFITKIKERFHRMDTAIDSKMSKAVDTADEAKEGLETIGKQAVVKATEITEKAEKKAQVIEKKSLYFTKRMRRASSPTAIMDTVLTYPKMIIIIVLLITIIIGVAGIPRMIENISGDMKVYLPQDDDTSKILNEVNQDWSTDMIVFFVETPNKFDITYPTNITDKVVLDEISTIEETLDYNKEDNGEEDEISFVLSISTLIKEINSAPKRIQEEASNEVGIPFSLFEPSGDYEIPDDQEDIDRIVAQIPEDTRRLLVADTNNDGIWDSAGVIMGVVSDNQEKLMDDVYKLIKPYFIDTRVESGHENSKEKWWERVEAQNVHCAMTPTGPVPMTVALTARTYQEFSVVLPAALLLICGMLILLHRTPKIVIISGFPIFCSLIITLGLMGLTGWVLSPQVILVAPILLALGVAYGLYIANRYSDEKKNIKDKKERMKVAIDTTGKAIFLSAVTTAVGFSSLMFVNMVPMIVLGFGLTTGIMICYIVTMLTVPSLVLLLDYEKKGKIYSAEKIGMIPIRHRKKIVIAAIIITIFSLALIPSIQANMNLTEMAPQDEPTIIKMEEYTEQFGGGMLGMVLIRGNPYEEDVQRRQGSMKDIDVLNEINDMENELKKINERIDDPKIKINPPISVVDVMKMIKIPQDIVDQILTVVPDAFDAQVEDTLNRSFWDAIDRAGQLDNINTLWLNQKGKTFQDAIIDIFYNSLTVEMRGFLVNQDYSKALVYIDMPSMDAARTEKAVDAVNDVVDEFPAGKSTSKLTGFAALIVAVNNLIMFNSLFSLFVALVIVFFVLIIIFRSLRLAALTMIPVSMVVAWEPLTLGVTGIDLNLITAMIGSIIVGIGIDYGIHMTERIRESGEDFSGIRKSVETSGYTFLEATATIVAGLLSIFLINIQSIQEFITMVIILLIFSMAGAMLLLPSIYAILSAEKTDKVEFKGEVAEVEPEYVQE